MLILNVNIKYYLISLFFLTILEFNSYGQNEEDVELRIDFTSGAVIANMKPKVIKPINDITIPLGFTDTVVADLKEVFDDPESGSKLRFKAKCLDTTLLKIEINSKNSAIKVLTIPDKVGRSKIVVTASDGVGETYDTFSVVIKETFKLKSSINDTIVKSHDSVYVVPLDISHILPVNSTEQYNISASSSDNALVSVNIGHNSNIINLIIADSGYGKADIQLVVTDSDLLSVKDNFTVIIMKSFGKKEYQKKRVTANPGITIFTGIDYSGVSMKLWIKDILGISFSGYYKWDQKSIGTDGQLMVKPPINFALQPYISVGGGYYRQTVITNYKNLGIKLEKDIVVYPIFGAAGIEAWFGKNKRHTIGIEAGYRYGKTEYKSITILTLGSKDVLSEKDSFAIEPLHLRIAYSIFLRKL